MRIRQPTQFPVEDHDVHYLLSHCACAELSTAGISQLSTRTTSQLMINRISFLVIKAITGDALWKATESAAIECTVSPRYISAYFLPKSIKRHVFNTCSQLELYRLHLTKHKLGKLPWFQFRLALSLCASFSYLIFFCVSDGTWSPPGLWGGCAKDFPVNREQWGHQTDFELLNWPGVGCLEHPLNQTT